MEGVTTRSKDCRGRAASKQEAIRICRRCMTGKPLSEYYGRKNAYGTVHRKCKACVRKIIWEGKYGLSWSQYEIKLKQQNNACAICLISLIEYRRRYVRYQEFCFDHCHATKACRGLLCHNCNRAIGMLQDNPSIMRRAAEYIELKR